MKNFRDFWEITRNNLADYANIINDETSKAMFVSDMATVDYLFSTMANILENDSQNGKAE